MQTTELVLEARFTEAGQRFRTGQVSAVVGNKVTVVTSGGGSLTIPRLATWTPAGGDIVVIAMTPAGWIALGKIA
jgi:hypothetical protein